MKVRSISRGGVDGGLVDAEAPPHFAMGASK
jgi:hypothetical protein